MKPRFPRAARLAALALCLAPMLAPAAAPAAPDMDAEWERFLAEADGEVVYPHYGLLSRLLDDGGELDPQACREAAGQLEQAMRDVPVGAAIHYYGYRCAEALGDAGAAEARLARFQAIARHALDQAPLPGDWAAAPMPVVGGRDALVILEALGLEHRSDVLSVGPRSGHLRWTLVAWDPQEKIERHLVFDYGRTAMQLERRITPPYYPQVADAYFDGLIESVANSGGVAAHDLLATRAAGSIADPAERVARLRPAAEQGGLHSSLRWLRTCREQPFDGCGEGLVDALLEGAEAGEALPTLVLAHAHAWGVGVERDEAAAMALLDKAEAILGGKGHGPVEYARLGFMLGESRLGPGLTERLRAVADATPLADAMLAFEAIENGDGRIPAPLLERLRLGADKGSPLAAGLLAVEVHVHGSDEEAVPLLARAAELGHPRAQLMYAWRLAEGDGVAKDRDQAAKFWREAAMSGDVGAMLAMGWHATDLEAWPEAAEWYRAAAINGSLDGGVFLAETYLGGHEGLDDDRQRGIDILEELSRREDGAAARRELANQLASGEWVAKDTARARKLLEGDAGKGDADSQFALGMALLSGQFGKSDPRGGERWLRRADEAGHVDALDALATWFFYDDPEDEKQRRKAYAIWEKAVGGEGEWSLNNYAWALCTASQDSLRDPARGLALALRMGEDLPPARRDTLAACHAANGDYAQAAAEQARALEEAGDAAEADMRERLATYRAGRAYIETAKDAPELPRAD